MDNLFGSPLSLSESFQRYTTIAPYQMPDGSMVENPNITAARQQAVQQSTQPAKSKTLLNVMMAGAVILAGVLIFIILKRK